MLQISERIFFSYTFQYHVRGRYFDDCSKSIEDLDFNVTPDSLKSTDGEPDLRNLIDLDDQTLDDMKSLHGGKMTKIQRRKFSKIMNRFKHEKDADTEEVFDTGMKGVVRKKLI